MKKNTYFELGGYEEYKGYGCEDRAMDCNIICLKKGKYKIGNEIYIHLYHPKNVSEKSKPIKHHMMQYYQCTKSKKHFDFHRKCKHKNKNIQKMINHRIKYIGNLDLYKQPNDYINSIPPYSF